MEDKNCEYYGKSEKYYNISRIPINPWAPGGKGPYELTNKTYKKSAQGAGILYRVGLLDRVLLLDGVLLLGCVLLLERVLCKRGPYIREGPI